MDITEFATLTPMKYYNNEDTTNLKRQAMIDNQDNLYRATEKHDGDWGMFIHYNQGNNLIRSRSISKVTGVYGDYTAKLPHLTEEMDTWPDNTVVLAEICWNEYGTNANTVGTILRCLPPKAVERQKENKLYGLMFDVLMYDHQDLINQPYEQRLDMLSKLSNHYFKPTTIFTTNFAEQADQIISAGGEGVVIQRKDNNYLAGTRTAWKTLKLKQSLEEMELPVIDTLAPKREYEGQDASVWPYWEIKHMGLTSSDEGFNLELEEYEEFVINPTEEERTHGTPVTKPYFFNWINGIVVQLPDGNTTSVTSGLTDADREWLATYQAKLEIESRNLFAVIKAMSYNDKGKLRHPYLVKLRTADDGAKGE